jgi:hypothetical protein
MADNLPLAIGHQRHLWVRHVAQTIDQARFLWATKGQFVQPMHCPMILGGFRANDHRLSPIT